MRVHSPSSVNASCSLSLDVSHTFPSLLSLLTWIFFKDHISLSTAPLYVGQICCFAVVLLVGQRAPCGVTEKGFCKKTPTIPTRTWGPARSSLQPVWIRSNVVSWWYLKDRSQSREESGPFSLIKHNMCVWIYPKALRRGSGPPLVPPAAT